LFSGFSPREQGGLTVFDSLLTKGFEPSLPNFVIVASAKNANIA
jgi:hypothetical protein